MLLDAAALVDLVDPQRKLVNKSLGQARPMRPSLGLFFWSGVILIISPNGKASTVRPAMLTLSTETNPLSAPYSYWIVKGLPSCW